ncbi:MAG: arsenate reductase ArsC [Candidatus Omnitrophica bacterium]|nr:arsenate reductase ArsC [Candidatus Omnitrophota bacterium]
MKTKVLFLCTGNSARSQMAEGFLRHMAGDRFEVFSAGLKPTQVNPLAIKVMAEVGIDISKHRSKSVSEFIGQNFDYVITVCDNAKQTCPVFPGKYEKIHWSLEDPAQAQGTEEEKLAVFMKVRDKILENIIAFLNSNER